MQIAIRPVDVWLFRDGKPFTAGEDHIAESTFPPSPFTLQGAIRTKVLIDKGIDLSEFARKGNPDPEIGYGDNFGKLHLRGPLLMQFQDDNWERLIPMPADLVNVEQKEESRYELLRPGVDLPFLTNLSEDLQLMWTRTSEHPKGTKDWLPESQWRRYLQGQAPEQVIQLKDPFIFEPRFGISVRPDKGTVQETMLYQARFVRLHEGVALWAEVSGVPIQEKGLLRFGGEGRAASFEVLGKPLPLLSQFNLARNATHFKVVLVAPAWFSGGWKPQGGDWSKIFGASVRLVGVALPRPLYLGGFDVAQGVPKPMHAFVSPGAVYFFEAKQPMSFADDFAFTETPDPIREQNNGANAWAHIGLGTALIGVW